MCTQAAVKVCVINAGKILRENMMTNEAERMDALVRFLLGEGEYMGLRFGDSVKYDQTRARFWWRTDLRKLWDETRASLDAKNMEGMSVGTAPESRASGGYCAEDAKGLRAETSGHPMPAAHTVNSEGRLDGVAATTAEATQEGANPSPSALIEKVAEAICHRRNENDWPCNGLDFDEEMARTAISAIPSLSFDETVGIVIQASNFAGTDLITKEVIRALTANGPVLIKVE